MRRAGTFKERRMSPSISMLGIAILALIVVIPVAIIGAHRFFRLI